MNIFSGQGAADTFRRYRETISKESDRGAVLVAAALLDSGLESALKKKLVPSAETKDPLFDNGSSSISTFSSKIELAFRLGLITESTKHMLHIFRKLRNDFAHSIDIYTLAEGRANDRLMAAFKKHSELYSSIIETFRIEYENVTKDYEINENFENFLNGPKGVRVSFDFFFACTAMAINHLEHAVKGIDELK